MAFKQKCILLITLCFISYYNSLQGEFVFDDIVAIVKNQDVTEPILSASQKTSMSHTFVDTTVSPVSSTSHSIIIKLKQIFNHDFWGYNLTDNDSHKSYRPLTILMFNLEYNLFNNNNNNANDESNNNNNNNFKSFFMKLINLIIHTTNTILVLKLFTRLVSTKEISFIGSILFAVHPIHTEVVCGIVGRTELMFAFFYLIALITYSNPKFGIQSNFELLPKYIFLVFISFTALLFKENAITILPTCIAFDITIRTNLFQKFKSRFILRRKIFYRCIILILITILFIICRLYIQNFDKPNFKKMDNPIGFCDNLLQKILSQNYLYVLNSWILLCPYWLSFDWALGCIELITSFLDIRNLSTILFWIIFYCLLLRSSRIVLLATILIIIPFIPASGIIKVGFVIAERILYVPSIGFCLLIAIGFGYLTDRYHNLRHIFYSCFIILVLVFILRTQQRGNEWKSEETLYSSALNVCPNNAKVHYNIAKVAADKGDKKKSFEYYHKAIRLYPNYEAAIMNLGNLYRSIGDLESAELYLRKSIDALKNFPAAWMNLGIVQAAKKNYNEAEFSYNKALSYRKNYPSCLYNMGNLYLDMQNYSLAMKYWHESVALNPKLSKAWANMLTFLDNRGLYEDVLHISDRALKYLPNDQSIKFIRANVLGKLKKYIDAEQLYLQIINQTPNNSLYQSNLGVLYHRWGKKDFAIERYQMALRIDPNNKSTRDNLQKLLRTIENQIN